jgi:plasmid stabilization system protein ParE
MIVRIDDDALAEARAQALYYLRHNPSAGKRFLDLLGRAFRDIGASPTSYPFLESLRHNKRFRRALIKGFPVFVVYEIIENEVLIVAVAHGSRRPGYWRARLRK